MNGKRKWEKEWGGGTYQQSVVVLEPHRLDIGFRWQHERAG